MRSSGIAASLLAISLTIPGHAEGYFLGVALGGGAIEVSELTFEAGNSFDPQKENGVIAGDLALGYEFANDVFVELGIEGYGTFFFVSDFLELDSIRASVGYTLPSDSMLRFYAKAGVAFWDLTVRESSIFNPGPEDSNNSDGTDLFVQVGAEYRFSETIRGGFVYDYANPQFGKASSIKLSLRVFFGR